MFEWTLKAYMRQLPFLTSTASIRAYPLGVKRL